MENNKSKFFAQFIAGILGGILLGIAASLIIMNYGGGFYGCWPSTSSLFGTNVSYKSCGGSFGAIAGVLIGAMLGIVIVSKTKITNYSKVAIWLIIGLFILPFLEVAIFWPPFEDSGFLLVPLVIFPFTAASIILSIIITVAINGGIFFRRKQ